MPQSSRVTLQKPMKHDWKCKAWEIDQVDSSYSQKFVYTSHKPIIVCTVNISMVAYRTKVYYKGYGCVCVTVV